jgi:hypothetical protein
MKKSLSWIALAGVMVFAIGCNGADTKPSATKDEQSRYSNPVKEVPKEISGGPGSGPVGPGQVPGPPAEALKGPPAGNAGN